MFLLLNFSLFFLPITSFVILGGHPILLVIIQLAFVKLGNLIMLGDLSTLCNVKTRKIYIIPLLIIQYTPVPPTLTSGMVLGWCFREFVLASQLLMVQLAWLLC